LWCLYLLKQESNENKFTSNFNDELNTELRFDKKKLEDEIKLKEEIINIKTKQFDELEKENKKLNSKNA